MFQTIDYPRKIDFDNEFTVFIMSFNLFQFLIMSMLKFKFWKSSINKGINFK